MDKSRAIKELTAISQDQRYIMLVGKFNEAEAKDFKLSRREARRIVWLYKSLATNLFCALRRFACRLDAKQYTALKEQAENLLPVFFKVRAIKTQLIEQE